MKRVGIAFLAGGMIYFSLADPIVIAITEFSTDTIFHDSSYTELPRVELFYTAMPENNVVVLLDSIVTTHGREDYGWPYEYELYPNVYNVVRIYGNILNKVSDTLRVYATFGRTVADTVYWPAEEISEQGAPAPPSGSSIARIPSYYGNWYIDYTPTFGKKNDDWGVITGKLLDSNQQVIPSTLHPCITAICTYGKVARRWMEDDGSYYLTLGIGKYCVSATADGYKTQVYPESVMVMDRDTTKNIDFFLEPMGITETKKGIKSQYSLLSPVLFRDEIKINFELQKPSYVKIEIFDKLGRGVVVLLHRKMKEGRHTLFWDRRDKNGRRIPQGLYFVTLETETFSITKKLTLMN